MRLLLALFALVVTSLAAAQPYAGNQKASPEDKKKLQTLEKAYVAAKANYTKKPKDAAAKKGFVTAAVKFGHESMMSNALDRAIKYKQALRVYREVLKIEPNNPVAKPESELIINIYKSLGKPVPKD
jgi:hypothetical protein